jgi:hypothetical protein
MACSERCDGDKRIAGDGHVGIDDGHAVGGLHRATIRRHNNAAMKLATTHHATENMQHATRSRRHAT